MSGTFWHTVPVDVGWTAVGPQWELGHLQTMRPHVPGTSCRAAMERQEGRVSSTFRHVMPVDESTDGVETVMDLKKLRQHQRQTLVDRGAALLLQSRSTLSRAHPFLHSSWEAVKNFMVWEEGEYFAAGRASCSLHEADAVMGTVP